MNVAKLLQALEELIFEVACLAVLLPKTFFGLAFSPRKAYAYVIDELQKKPEDRFDRYTSPLILWSVTGVLPHFIILSIYAANPTISKPLAANTDDILLKMLTLSAEVRFAALSAFAVSLPLAFAVVITRERKQRTAKSSLREPLYTLCYCTAPVLLAAMPLWGIWVAQLSGTSPDMMDSLLSGGGTVLMVWTAWIGASLFRPAPGHRLGAGSLSSGQGLFCFSRSDAAARNEHLDHPRHDGSGAALIAKRSREKQTPLQNKNPAARRGLYFDAWPGQTRP